MRGLIGKSPIEPKEVRIDSPNAVNIVTIFPMRSNKINHMSWSTLLLAKKQNYSGHDPPQCRLLSPTSPGWRELIRRSRWSQVNQPSHVNFNY